MSPEIIILTELNNKLTPACGKFLQVNEFRELIGDTFFYDKKEL